jgi:hypothetical protein
MDSKNELKGLFGKLGIDTSVKPELKEAIEQVTNLLLASSIVSYCQNVEKQPMGSTTLVLCMANGATLLVTIE